MFDILSSARGTQRTPMYVSHAHGPDIAQGARARGSFLASKYNPGHGRNPRIPSGLTPAPDVTVLTAREPPDVPPAVGWRMKRREKSRNKLGTAGRQESEKKGFVTQDFEIIPRDIWLLASSDGHGFSSPTGLSQVLPARPGFVLHLDRREAFSYDPWCNCEFS